MENASKRSLVQEEVELTEGKVGVSDVWEDWREIQSAEIHHGEDHTELLSLRKNPHASVEASPPQKLHFAQDEASKDEAVASKTKDEGDTLTPDDRLAEAPESSFLVHQKQHRFSSDKVLVQPESFVSPRGTTVGRKDVSDKMSEMSSQSVSAEQPWTGLFSPITAPPQNETPRNHIHEDILPLERCALLTSAKGSRIHDQSSGSLLGNKESGALGRGRSDEPTSVVPQTKVLPPVEGHQSRRPSAMRPGQTEAEAQANDPDKEKAEALHKGICFLEP